LLPEKARGKGWLYTELGAKGRGGDKPHSRKTADPDERM